MSLKSNLTMNISFEFSFAENHQLVIHYFIDIYHITLDLKYDVINIILVPLLLTLNIFYTFF